ncbi:MAG: FAD binding domain-containing protein, partial [Candidatus Ornithospirochaeta sp.]
MEEMKCYLPESLEEALSIMAETGALPLAGGSDLMVSGANGTGVDPTFSRPVVIITGLKELSGISVNEDGWTEIGALTTSREIAESDLCHPLLRDAASHMGAVALRNSATIGGNIANASPKGDTPQPLILLDAEVVLKSTHGERRMKVDDFILGAKKTKIEKGELITAVLVPPSDLTHYYYKKVGMRRANAISKLTLSCGARVEDGVVEDFRASSGAAGPKVIRSREAESILIGKRLDELQESKEEFLDAWNNAISPRAMADYRRSTTRRMLSHFIDELSSGAPEGRIL